MPKKVELSLGENMSKETAGGYDEVLTEHRDDYDDRRRVGMGDPNDPNPGDGMGDGINLIREMTLGAAMKLCHLDPGQ